MKRLLLALLILFAAGSAAAETCTSTAGGTWSGSGGQTGTATWSGCTQTRDDNFVIGHTMTTTADLGTSASPITGTITVNSGGALSISAGVTVYSTNSVRFETGSCAGDTCTIAGQELTAVAAPTVTYPTATTINFDFDNLVVNGNTLPWTICAAACTTADVHAAASGLAATQILVGWEKLGATQIAQIVGTDQLSTEFVDAPGLWLEVTAVNAAGNDFTVTLPSLYTNTLEDHYAVAEAVSTLTLQNIKAGTSWTVADVETRENNEGKIRYETVLDEADTNFNSDHEFEGYLACKQGTDRCLRITETEANYELPTMPGTAVDTGSEMFVTWKNPADSSAPYWTAGDELDIYYAKINTGDMLQPVNPVRFDFTGSTAATLSNNQSFRVSAGSELFTITGTIFSEPHMANDTVNEGNVSFENYATSDEMKTLEKILVEGCSAGVGGTTERVIGVASSTLPACIRVQDRDSVGGTGVGVRNVRWSEISFRWPQEDIDFTTNPTVDGFGQVAIQMTEQTGEAISNASDFAAGNVTDWTNMSLRKIRIEGFTAGIGVANTGIFKNCPDDAWIQDALILHSRSRKGDDSGANMANYTRRGEDMLESFGATPTCGYDRFVINGSNVGTSLGPLRHARQGRTWYSSFSIFGGSGKMENAYGSTDWGTGRRPYMNAAIAHNIPSGGEGHTHSFPAADSDGVAVSNFLTDGAIQNLSGSYYQQIGWYRSTTGVIKASSCGQFQVGSVFMGGGNFATVPNGNVGCAGPYDTITIADNLFLNLGRHYNSGSGQTCTTAGASEGTSIYPCVGSNSSAVAMLYGNNSGATPTPIIDFTRNLVHRGARSYTNWGYSFYMLDNTTEPLVLNISDSTFISEAGSVNSVVYFNPAGITSMSLENVWADSTGNDTCYAVAANVNRADCDFTATPTVALDFSTDDSPHGDFELYVSGDIANMKDISVVGSSGGTGTPTDAQPRYAGLVAWEWPHAWMTPELIGVRRGDPIKSYIPPVLRRRMNSGGAGSRPNFAPTPFGNP